MLRSKAEGHTANIFLFDKGVVMVPFSTREARFAKDALKLTMEILEASGDFPERPDYQKLYTNLDTAETISKKTVYDQVKAEGHDALIWQFGQDVAMVPMNTNETMLTERAIERAITLLESETPFPENAEYERLKRNLITAEFQSRETS